MEVQLPDIRPAVLSTEQSRAIDEIRTFRHVFRHMYQHDLDPERLALVDSRTPSAIDAFREAHRVFDEQLDKMIEAFEAG